LVILILNKKLPIIFGINAQDFGLGNKKIVFYKFLLLQINIFYYCKQIKNIIANLQIM